MEIPFKASGLEHGTPARKRHRECRSSSRVCSETVGCICAIEMVWPVLHGGLWCLALPVPSTHMAFSPALPSSDYFSGEGTEALPREKKKTCLGLVPSHSVHLDVPHPAVRRATDHWGAWRWAVPTLQVFLLSSRAARSAPLLSVAQHWLHARASKAIFSICSWFFPYSVYGALPSFSCVQGMWLCLAPATRAG